MELLCHRGLAAPRSLSTRPGATRKLAFSNSQILKFSNSQTLKDASISLMSASVGLGDLLPGGRWGSFLSVVMIAGRGGSKNHDWGRFEAHSEGFSSSRSLSMVALLLSVVLGFRMRMVLLDAHRRTECRWSPNGFRGLRVCDAISFTERSEVLALSSTRIESSRFFAADLRACAQRSRCRYRCAAAARSDGIRVAEES